MSTDTSKSEIKCWEEEFPAWKFLFSQWNTMQLWIESVPRRGRDQQREGDCWFKDSVKRMKLLLWKMERQITRREKTRERTRISQHWQHLRRTLKHNDLKVWKEFQQSGEGHYNKETWGWVRGGKRKEVGRVVRGRGAGVGEWGSEHDPIMASSNYSIFSLPSTSQELNCLSSCRFTTCSLLNLLPSTEAAHLKILLFINSRAISQSFLLYISTHHFMPHLLHWNDLSRRFLGYPSTSLIFSCLFFPASFHLKVDTSLRYISLLPIHSSSQWSYLLAQL